MTKSVAELQAAFERKQQEYVAVRRLSCALMDMALPEESEVPIAELHQRYQEAWVGVLEAAKANGRIPSTTVISVML